MRFEACCLLEGIIMWTNNETSAWLADKTKADSEEIIEQARKDTATMHQAKSVDNTTEALVSKLQFRKANSEKIKKDFPETVKRI
ncbi:hypothetical protein MAR_011088 [Mya arenaria]|uniref:Uncharacterized protein n=1 Tax=Mya arenaria TaxID=6604 RepID=A0ABY7FWX0_MYAAR|nr:hypothetical protein MAR_011088 [Mya arenaria]